MNNRNNEQSQNLSNVKVEELNVASVREWTSAEQDAISFLGQFSAFMVRNYFTIKDVKQEFSKGGGLIATLTQEDLDAIPGFKQYNLGVDDVKEVGYWFATKIDDDDRAFETVAPRMNRLRKVAE